jgi:hypothetical protein
MAGVVPHLIQHVVVHKVISTQVKWNQLVQVVVLHAVVTILNLLHVVQETTNQNQLLVVLHAELATSKSFTKLWLAAICNQASFQRLLWNILHFNGISPIAAISAVNTAIFFRKT